MLFVKKYIRLIVYHLVLISYLIFLFYKANDSFHDTVIIVISIFSGISIGAMILKNIGMILKLRWLNYYREEINSAICSISYSLLAILTYGFLLKFGIKRGSELTYFAYNYQSILFCISSLSLVSMFLLNASQNRIKNLSGIILTLVVGITYFYYKQMLGDFLYFGSKQLYNIVFGISLLSDIFQISIAFILLKNLINNEIQLEESALMQKLLFVATIISAYMFLMQYLVIYYFNNGGPLDLIAYKKSFVIIIDILVLLKYIIPFALLIAKSMRKKISVVTISILLIFLGTYVEFVWYSILDIILLKNNLYYSMILMLLFGIIFILPSINKKIQIQAGQQ